MQTTGVQEQESYVRTAIPSSPVAYALIQYSRFQFSHFFKICWEVGEDTDSVSGVKQFEESKEILIGICS